MAQIRLSPSKSKLPSSDGLVEPRSLTKDAWLRLRKNRLAMFGLIFFTCITILSFLGPLFYQHSPEGISLSLGSQPPFTSVQLIEVRFDEENTQTRLSPRMNSSISTLTILRQIWQN